MAIKQTTLDWRRTTNFPSDLTKLILFLTRLGLQIIKVNVKATGINQIGEDFKKTNMKEHKKAQLKKLK